MKPIISWISTDDFDVMRDRLTGWDYQYHLLEAGPFYGSQLFSQIGALQIARNQWGRHIHYRGTPASGHFGLALSLNQRDHCKWLGLEAGPSDLIIQQAGQQADLITSSTWDRLVMAIPTEELAQRASALMGDDFEGVQAFYGVAHLKPGAYGRLKSLALAYCHALKLSLKCEETSAKIPQMSQILISTMIRELIATLPNRFEKPGMNSSHQIVKLAEDYVEGCAYSPFRIEDICRNLSICERTLFYAFNDEVGMSPMHWLRLKRLNDARHLLKIADPKETLIKQVALSNNFLHLGRFSVDYKKLFGEAPSETLRRQIP